MAIKVKGTLLMAAIGDESTVTGLLLTGLGERNLKGQTNFFIVDKDTKNEEIEEVVNSWLQRTDIGIILISQNVAEIVREIIVAHDKVIPTILEIPSKGTPYEAEKDTIVLSAASKLWGSDTGFEKLRQMQANLR